jgi:hypothetical protein
MPKRPSPHLSAIGNAGVVLAVLLAFVAGGAGCSAAEDASGPHAIGTSGQLAVRPSIRVSGGIADWLASVDAAGARSPYAECAPVAELEGAHACVWSSAVAMNQALIRASLYAEGNFGARRGEIASLDDAAYSQGIRVAGGHDLRREQLGPFWETLGRACAEKGPSYCATAAERELFEAFVLPRLASGAPFVLIAFPTNGGQSVIAHEILHAQYFVLPAFRQQVDGFWASAVPEHDKATIRQELAPAYDVSDDLLVRNEFMAYVLSQGPLLQRFTPIYGAPLRDALSRAGAPPLVVP